ncbi:MAG: response regulator [Cyclobacteriaceae bacterium]|nr:response regulator [Cyclobacteriaceae bacterium]
MMNKYVILCVDDEKMVLSSIRQQLRANFGNELIVEVAESGEEALTLIQDLEEQQMEVPVIICDQIMPGMKGDRVIIETYKKNPKTLSVLLTGQADAASVGNIINQSSLFRYISKPWDETDLTLTIREALRSYQQDKTLEEQNEILTQLNESLERKVQERTAEIVEQNEEIMRQNLEIRNLNTNLEKIVEERTRKIEVQTKKLVEYANFNAHQLRAPLARVLGLLELARMNDEGLTIDVLFGMLKAEIEDLDRIIRNMSRALEEGNYDMSNYPGE